MGHTTTRQHGSRRTRAGRVTAAILGGAVLAALIPLLVVLLTGPVMHRTHETSFILFASVLISGALFSVAARPATAPGALRVVLAAGVANLIVAILTGRIDPIGIVLVVIAVAVDLAGGFGMLRGATTWHMRRWEAVLPALLVIGFRPYIWEQIRLQTDGAPTDEHVRFGHYALMATILLAVALAGLVGTSGVRGNHVAGTLVGALAALLGLGSLVTGSVSAFGLEGELALVVGGLLFVWMVQLERMGLHPQSPGRPDG